MQHKYTREYDYSDKFSSVRVSMDNKIRLKDFAESLCDADNGFVSMKTVLDAFLDGNETMIKDYLAWLKGQR